MKKIVIFFKNTKIFYFLVFVFFGLIFLAHYQTAGQAVYGDGIEYYAWLHTIYFDHDLNFENEYRHIYNNTYNNNFPNAENNQKPVKTPTGKVGNYHPPGMAILLFPFYFIADLIVILGNFFGFHLLRNGYSDIYQVFTGLGAVAYSVLGLWITEKLFKKIFSKIKINKILIYRIGIFTIVFTSPLIYYLSIDVLNSHFASFFATSVFFYFLFTRKVNYLQSVFLGFLIGFATLIRVQEAALFVPFLTMLIFRFYEQRKNLLKTLISLAIAFFIFLITISPMLFAWNYLYGSVVGQDYLFNFLKNTPSLNFFGSLFDLNNGLFTKSPFLILLLFLIPLAFKDFKKELVVFISYFIVQFVIITLWGGWIAASFGGRMYISSLFLFFLLSILLFSKVNRKISISLATFFILLNFIAIFNFMLFTKQASNGKFGIESYTKVRIQKILRSISIP